MLQGLKWAIANNNSFTGHSTNLGALFVKKIAILAAILKSKMAAIGRNSFFLFFSNSAFQYLFGDTKYV